MLVDGSKIGAKSFKVSIVEEGNELADSNVYVGCEGYFACLNSDSTTTIVGTGSINKLNLLKGVIKCLGKKEATHFFAKACVDLLVAGELKD